MARRLSAEWRAEWRERLVRFRGWTGTAGEFCRQQGISRSSLLRWVKRVAVTVPSRPGTSLVRGRAKLEADNNRQLPLRPPEWTPVCRTPPGTFHPLTRVGLFSALRWVRFTRSFPGGGDDACGCRIAA
jgi:hypothetical protein